MRRTYLIPLLTLAIATSAHAQPDFSKVEIKAQKVAGNVYMLVGQGGNIGVSAGEDGIVIVDDQYAPLAPKIEAALKTIVDKPVRFVLNTHYHGDHTGGNEHFGRTAPIVAHTNVRKRLQNGVKRGNTVIPPAPKGALPVVTFDERLAIHLNGEEVRAVHFPSGHTDGDAVIFFTQSNVVHLGDDYFNGFFPFVDRENGGSVRGLIANIDKIHGMINDEAKVIPGHGPLGDRTSLRKYLEMLRATWAAVDKGMKSGKSLAQLREEKVLAQWDSWGGGFIKTDVWIETLYRELGGAQ